MKFKETPFEQLIVIEPEPHRDERGEFARMFCAKEFAQVGIPTQFVQSSYSTNHKKGLIRGLHFQREPFMEGKLVRCVRGAIFDVVVDLRRQSKTFAHWYSIELTADNHVSIWIPKGFAHGYQTLTEETEIHYSMDQFYSPEHATGIPFDDPTLEIKWPLIHPTVSEKDRAFAALKQ